MTERKLKLFWNVGRAWKSCERTSLLWLYLGFFHFPGKKMCKYPLILWIEAKEPTKVGGKPYKVSIIKHRIEIVSNRIFKRHLATADDGCCISWTGFEFCFVVRQFCPIFMQKFWLFPHLLKITKKFKKNNWLSQIGATFWISLLHYHYWTLFSQQLIETGEENV